MLCLLTFLQWTISRAKVYNMWLGPTWRHWPSLYECWGMLSVCPVYWTAWPLLEFPELTGMLHFDGQKPSLRRGAPQNQEICILTCWTFCLLAYSLSPTVNSHGVLDNYSMVYSHWFTVSSGILASVLCAPAEDLPRSVHRHLYEVCLIVQEH